MLGKYSIIVSCIHFDCVKDERRQPKRSCECYRCPNYNSEQFSLVEGLQHVLLCECAYTL